MATTFSRVGPKAGESSIDSVAGIELLFKDKREIVLTHRVVLDSCNGKNNNRVF